jgi:putative membrane protein
VASFVFGMMIMLVGLQGPLHELSDYFLFSAHMVQHLLIMVVMPPFLLAGTPGWALRPVMKMPDRRNSPVGSPCRSWRSR